MFVYQILVITLIFAAVKILFSLLSLFMLYMNCLPCGDGNECKNDEEQQTSIVANQQGHEHEPEICTPFCSCSCCASVNFVQANYQQKHSPALNDQLKFPALQDNFDSYLSHSVWQPPRFQAFI